MEINSKPASMLLRTSKMSLSQMERKEQLGNVFQDSHLRQTGNNESSSRVPIYPQLFCYCDTREVWSKAYTLLGKMGFLKSQRHKNRPKTIEIEGVKITKNNAKTTYHQSLDSSPCPLWLVLVLALARLPLLFLFFLPSTAALYPAIPLFIVKSINMTANDPQKIYKTSGIFFVFVAVTVLFAWAQYAVPLEHVSTQERLQASKQAYTSKRNNENRQRQGQKSAQTSSKQQDAGEPWQSSLQSTETQNRPDYHVVFSTSCSEQQNWESYVFFYHAMKVKQPGNVTRIASACTAKESKEQTDFFNKYIHPMNPGNFHLHLTPDYGKVALAHGHYYKYMNKRESCGTGTRCLNGSVLVYGF